MRSTTISTTSVADLERENRALRRENAALRAATRATKSRSSQLTEIDELLTVTEAATFLRTSRAGVYALMKNGSVPYSRVRARRRIPKSALVAYAQRNLVEAK